MSYNQSFIPTKLKKNFIVIFPAVFYKDFICLYYWILISINIRTK